MTPAGYWPWWLGGLLMGSSVLVWFWATGRALGVSSMFTRLMDLRHEREVDRAEAALPSDSAELERMLLAATVAEFGQAAQAAPPKAATATTAAVAAPRPRLRWQHQLLFLSAMAAGGLSARLWSGPLAAAPGLGPEFDAWFGGGWLSALVLGLGGVCVGAGAAMSGGCTSGHGLSGCSRLERPSLLATASFVGAAVATALLLGRLLA